MEFRPLPADSPDLVGYSQPELMAIGDSIYNGTRSLSTTPGLARFSIPVIVARGLGLSGFRAPDYPRAVLFDLERHINEGLSLDRLRLEILENAESWLDAGGVWSSQRFFDNIATAGAAFENLEEDIGASMWVLAETAYRSLHARSDLDFDLAYNLYYALNAAFLLNPSGDSDLSDLSPLEQVASRKPRRLLINIGNNEGLFNIGLTANFSRANIAGVQRIPALAKRLGQLLSEHCADVEHIYYSLLIRPRTLANLAPRTDEDLFAPPPNGGYFDEYLGRLGALNGMKAHAMRDFDALIKTINDKTVEALQESLGDRVHFVDLYALSEKHDRKHGTEVEALRMADNKRLSNYPLSANLFGFRQGGLFGLDNMHPTLPGYTLLANEIGNVISQVEGVSHTPASIQDAYEADSLLQDPPRSWDFLMLLASFAGVFFRAGNG